MKFRSFCLSLPAWVGLTLLYTLALPACSSIQTSGLPDPIPSIVLDYSNVIAPLPSAIAPYRTDEYQSSATLEAIHAAYAYAASQGAMGEGIKIAVIDSGVLDDNPELQGQVYAKLDIFDGLYDASYARTSNVPEPTWFGPCQPNTNTNNFCIVDSRDQATLIRNPDSPTPPLALSHGTAVASVIAAHKGNSESALSVFPNFHGVAPAAEILSIRSDNLVSCTGEEPADDECWGGKFFEWTYPFAIEAAKNYGAQIINISIGSPVEPSSTFQIGDFLEKNDLIIGDFLERDGLIDINGLIFSVAAGNIDLDAVEMNGGVYPESAKRPNHPAVYAGVEGIKGQMIIAGVYDSTNDVIVNYSNRAGSGPEAEYYLLVPTPQLVDRGKTYQGYFITTEGYLPGTSFAAPVISGSLALLLDTFPELETRPEDAITILLETADDYVSQSIDPVAGVAAGVGQDVVGGRGILNLQNAFTPRGDMVASIGGEAIALSLLTSAPAGAFGDWNQGAFTGIVFFDDYQRGFNLDQALMATSASSLRHLSARLADTGTREHALEPFEFGYSEVWRLTPEKTPLTELLQTDPQSILGFSTHLYSDKAHLSFGYGGALPKGPGPTLYYTGRALTSDTGQWAHLAYNIGALDMLGFAEISPSHTLAGLGVSKQAENWQIQASFRYLDQSDQTLGSSVQSAFGGKDNAQTASLSLEGQLDLPKGWGLSARIEAGHVSLSEIESGAVMLSAWSVQASHALAGGSLSLGIAQPLRAESGSISFETAFRPEAGGRIETLTRHASLTPSGREIDLEIHWNKALPLSGWSVSLGAAAIFEAWHTADAAPSAAGWLGLKRRW